MEKLNDMNCEVIVNVLGRDYTIAIVEEYSIDVAEECMGVCDGLNKRIEILMVCDDDPKYLQWHYSRVILHELIHAFFDESGLCDSWWNDTGNKCEILVDWLANQLPKIILAVIKATEGLQIL